MKQSAIEFPFSGSSAPPAQIGVAVVLMAGEVEADEVDQVWLSISNQIRHATRGECEGCPRCSAQARVNAARIAMFTRWVLALTVARVGADLRAGTVRDALWKLISLERIAGTAGRA